MSDERLIAIETKLAHQERVVDELNIALTDQQSRLSELEAVCRSLLERVKSISDAAPASNSPDERPPHY